jgi:regulation of enolase protein 1 (concanavalin A-like superfamily)
MNLEWLNEPAQWQEESSILHVTTEGNTDFWRETHYGFVRDSGHFRFARTAGDFTAHVLFEGDYRELYDQAGLMLRLDERHWIKAGVEFVDGRRVLSCVVTRDFSDWSTVPLIEAPNPVRLRLTRHGAAVRVDWAPKMGSASPDVGFQMLRLAYLPARDPALVGPMCCSPERASFQVRFEGFSVDEPIARELHA